MVGLTLETCSSILEEWGAIGTQDNGPAVRSARWAGGWGLALAR